MIKFFKLTCLLFIGLMTCSCSNEDPVLSPISENEELITFSFDIDAHQENESSTRSLAPGYHFSDGSSITEVKCYIYAQSDGAAAQPFKTLDIPTSNLKGEISVTLPASKVYDVVFLATSIPQTNSSSKLYYSTTERSLNINYGLVNGNDEELDCFYAVIKDFTSGSSATTNVILKRPFAQLNIGAKDYAAYDAAFPVQSSSVSVNGIYNKMTLMDGNVSGSPINVTFGASQMPDNQTYPISGAQYISMNYLLVKERKLIDLHVELNHYNTSTIPLVMNYTNIAVERNYQTNLTIRSLNN